MGDVRLALEGAFEEESSVAGGAQPLPPPVVATRAATMRRVAAFVAVAVGAAGVAGAAVWIATRPLPPRVSRTTITGSGPTALAVIRSGGHLAITPDGSRVVYVGNNATQLFVRALDALEPTALVSGGSLASPFISPDGQWVGFFDNNTSLKKVAISGGPAYAVATLDGGAIQGGTWLSDDTIVVATGTVPLGLQSVPANGGAPTELTTVDTARGESDHVFPEALPGRRAVLFTITSLTGGSGARSIAVYDLDTHTQTILVRGGSLAKFMASGSSSSLRAGRHGHLVYVEASTLRAVSFDPVRLAVLGRSVLVVSRVMTGDGASAFAVAADGTLVYADLPGEGTADLARTVMWVDRTGKEEPVAMPPRPYQQVRVSPDGTRLALTAEGDIWTWDLGRQSMTKLTFDPASDTFPIWTADSRRIVYASQRAGAFNLWWQGADGRGAAERLTTHDTTQAPNGLARTERCCSTSFRRRPAATS